MSDEALIEAMARVVFNALFPREDWDAFAERDGMRGSRHRIVQTAFDAATAALAAIRKTHAVVPREQAHDARAWEMVAQTMERSRDDVRSAVRELLDAYSAYFPPGNPWGDKVRQALGFGAEGHDPTNPFAPRERPKKSIRLMTDAERRAAGLDPNGGFDGPTGAD